jgi:hypothetical protein
MALGVYRLSWQNMFIYLLKSFWVHNFQLWIDVIIPSNNVLPSSLSPWSGLQVRRLAQLSCKLSYLFNMTTCVHCQQINVIETEEAIKNEQSRNTENIRHTKHRTTTNQKKNKKTQHRKLKRWATWIPSKNWGWTHVIAKSKQLLLLIRPCHVSYIV